MDPYTTPEDSQLPLADQGTPSWLPDPLNATSCLSSPDEVVAMADLIFETSPTTDKVSATTASTARLQAGDVVTGFVNKLKDHDWYRISLAAGQAYQFNLAAAVGSNLDSQLRLRNGAGSVLASNDDSNGTLDSQIKFTATSSGTYYLDAGAYANSTTGQYLLSATQVVTAPIAYNSTTGYGEASVERAIESLLGKPIADLPTQFSGGLYGLDRIGAPEAWSAGYTGQGMVVAVIDTGVDRNHVDLDANMWVNARETFGDGIDNDGNGFVDDYYGWNFSNNNSNPYDDNSHGTHVAGTIAGENNGMGVTGVAYDAKIMAVKVLDANGSGTLSNIAKGIRYAADNGAHVINLSLGGSSGSSELQSAVQYAWSKGVSLMMAAGNSGGSSPIFPAAYAKQYGMAIGAINSTGALASFSNRAGSVTLDYVTAAGVSIYSTIPGNSYATLSGTSMATPQMAGAMALLMQANKASGQNLSLAQLESLFTSTALNSITAAAATNTNAVVTASTTASASLVEMAESAPESVQPSEEAVPSRSASANLDGIAINRGDIRASQPQRYSALPNHAGAAQNEPSNASEYITGIMNLEVGVSGVRSLVQLDGSAHGNGSEELTSLDPLTGIWSQPWQISRG